jgi:uncharacterized membrane protein YphA (DoxX/SURF4 family)
VVLAGALVGALLSKWTSRIEPRRLARIYFVLIAVILALRTVAFVCGIVLANASIWNTIGAAIGDAGSFLFGALFGIAVLRTERREILCDPAVYSILCLSSGLGFVLSGYIKALYMQGMIEFFTKSGYSTSFLKFIMTIEVVGGIGLLIPWTVLSAIAGLSVDMFGAIYTHIHNGDPLNDSTGAIGALIRLGTIVALWAWRPRSGDVEGSVRRHFVAAGLGMAFCISAAVAGSALIRRLSPPPAAPKSSARVLGDPDLRQGALIRTYYVVLPAPNQSRVKTLL